MPTGRFPDLGALIAAFMIEPDPYEKADLIGLASLDFPLEQRTAHWLEDLTAELEQGRLSYPQPLGLAHALPRLLRHHDLRTQVQSLAQLAMPGRQLVLEVLILGITDHRYGLDLRPTIETLRKAIMQFRQTELMNLNESTGRMLKKLTPPVRSRVRRLIRRLAAAVWSMFS